MASFVQWASSFKGKELAPRVSWVCGSDLVLVEEVVSRIRKLVNVGTLDYQTFTVGITPDVDIWLAMATLSIDTGQPTLTIVRDAHKFSDWGHLYSILKLKNMGYVVFVSAEDDFAREKPKGDQKIGDLKPHIKAIQGKGAIVRCATPGEEDLVKWAKLKLPGASDVVLTHLVQRSGHDTRIIRDACIKLKLFKATSIAIKTIDSLVPPKAVDEFTDCLITGDKKLALLAEVDHSECTGIIRLLDSRVDLLHHLYSALMSNMSVRDISVRYKVSDFLVRKYSPHARAYDATRRDRLKRVLAALEEQSMAGAQDGLIEALVALW